MNTTILDVVAVAIGALGIFLAVRAWRESRVVAGRSAEESKHYRSLFENYPVATWISAPDTLAVLDVNDTAVKRYGFTREEFLALTLADIHSPEDVPKLREALNPRNAASGVHRAGVWKHRRKDGRFLDAEILLTAIEFAGRKARLVLADDVTNRVYAEDQLREAKKMDAVQRLAGGLAHEFNNLFTVIAGNCGVLLDRKPGPEEVECLEEIRTSTERAADLTRQLLAFARKQVLRPRVVNPNALVVEAKEKLRNLIPKSVKIVTRLAEDVGFVAVDPDQIQRVIIDLAINACNAMEEGGTLAIETANVELEDLRCEAEAEAASGRYVLLVVSDTGAGMAPETRQHLFEPFFTTRARATGTSLGLATAYGTVRQSDGHVWLYSEPGKGTTIKIFIPRVIEQGELPAA